VKTGQLEKAEKSIRIEINQHNQNMIRGCWNSATYNNVNTVHHFTDFILCDHFCLPFEAFNYSGLIFNSTTLNKKLNTLLD